MVVTTAKPGDFVVCNLASLSLGKIPVEDDAYMEDLVETAVRALDNVIDLNFYPRLMHRLPIRITGESGWASAVIITCWQSGEFSGKVKSICTLQMKFLKESIILP